MAEQFRLNERFGQRRAVHRHERPIPTRAEAVEAFGHQFLAGPALSNDEHRSVEMGRAADAFDAVEKGERLPNELIVALHC